ncbi:NAD(P)-dependent oxidoreductase [Candidatus Pacearchaeota archaeon]|nr:NAD(P)-dependent oxidoreductase [Candidatus Pacearchaeota archaeon]
MKKEKILITGGLGHIGSKLIRELYKNRDIEKIRILDNLSTQRYCSLFNLPNDVRFEFMEGDIRNKQNLEGAVQDMDTIIHLAAITDAPSTIKYPELTFEVNLQGTLDILDIAQKNNVKKFIFPSTTSVYGEAKGILDETYIDCKPATPYAESKLKCEKEVNAAGKKGGIETYVLRFGTIFGTSIGMRFHTAVNKFCYLGAMNKPITVWEDALNQKRPYLGINDAIRAISFVWDNAKSGETYNVLTDNYTVQEILDSIKKYIPGIKIEFTPSPILNQQSYEISNKKICSLGFTHKDSLSEQIGDTIRLFQAIKN